MNPTTTDGLPDLQETRPLDPYRITATGVSNLQIPIVIEDFGAATAQVTLATGLSEDKRGTHMSRLAQAAIEAAETEHPSLTAYLLAVADAAAEVFDVDDLDIRGRCTMVTYDRAPVSGEVTTEQMEHFAQVLVEADDMTATFMSGVRVTGITACPCAQALVADSTRRELVSIVGEDKVDEVMAAVPGATHNQRSDATFATISKLPVATKSLISLAREGLSAQTGSVLKRSDEAAVVDEAHANPLFVEDSVREMYSQAITTDGLPGEVFICHQHNHESIHSHDAWALIIGDRERVYDTTDPLPLDCRWILIQE